MRFFLIITGFLALFAHSVVAGDNVRTINVTGQGQVEAVPDMATITLGVTQQAQTAAEAMALVASATGNVFDALSGMDIAPQDMQTSDLNLYPVFSSQSSSNNAPPKIIGYTASNRVTIRVRDLDALGAILDQLTRSSANEFNSLQFGLQEPGPLDEQARIAAVKDGMARAALLAEAAGVTLGPLLTMNEHGGGGQPIMMARAAVEFAPMPIAAGEVGIHASVDVVFVISD